MTQTPGNPSDSFEEFRREKRMRTLQRELKDRLQSRQGQILRIMEDQEQSEVVERRIRREMQEFFEESTRLAAQVLADVAASKAEEIATRINNEMREFFQDIMGRAETTVEGIRFALPEVGCTDLETHMDRETVEQFGGQVPQDIKVGSETETPAEALARLNREPEETTNSPAPEEALPADRTELYIPEASRPESAPEPEGEPPVESPEETEDPVFEEETVLDPASSTAKLMESLSADPSKLKEALTALYRAGVIDRDQAREIFLAKRQEA